MSIRIDKPYFKYDLGAEKFVKALVVIGLQNDFAPRSENWIAYVGNDPTDFANNTPCVGGSAAAGQEVTCNSLGKYVIIQKQDDIDYNLSLNLIVIFEGCDCSSWMIP